MIAAEKTSQVMLHMSVAFAVTYIATGSFVTGGLAAIVEPVCNVALMPYHEKAWKKLRLKWQSRKRQGNLSADGRATVVANCATSKA